MMDFPHDVNAKLDAVVHTRMLFEIGFLTLDEAADTTGISRSTLSRVRDGAVSNNIDISGLRASVIRELYQTASGVAVRCQLAESDLRMADFGFCHSSVALGLIPAAEALLTSIEDGNFSRMQDVDRLAVGSLRSQVALYKARSIKPKSAKTKQYQSAYDDLQSHADKIVRIVILGDQTCDSDKLLGLRMLLNFFFAAWELDEINEDGINLPRAKGVASRLCEGGFLAQGRRIARMIYDPRLSYQLAEAAAVVGQHYSAAALLADAMEMTGHDHAIPLSWVPAWLPVSITTEPHFQQSIALLLSAHSNKKEK